MSESSCDEHPLADLHSQLRRGRLRGWPQRRIDQTAKTLAKRLAQDATAQVEDRKIRAQVRAGNHSSESTNQIEWPGYADISRQERDMKQAGKAALILASLLPLTALAAEPRYTYLEGGYQYLDIDAGSGIDADGDGFGVGGSLSVTDHVHLLASYSSIDLDFSIDASEYSVGVGGRLPVSENVHLTGSVGWGWAELDTPIGDFEDDGLLASAGVRWMATPDLELSGALNYVDLDEAGDDTTLSIGGLFQLTPDLAVGLGANIGDDVTAYEAGLRYYFPGTL